MIQYPYINPVFIRLGPLKIRWYGLMYVLGFVAVHILVSYQTRLYSLKKLEEHFENLNFYLIVSLILGGRLGYVLFYNFSFYFAHPTEILSIWQGGMSFHGALIACFLGGWFYCWKNKLNYLESGDIYVVTAPIGLGLGRLGNFINGELYGRVSDVSWAMVFPEGGSSPRHPSQLYEFFLEGVLLFILLWVLRIFHHRHRWPHGTLCAIFLVFYGLFRVFVEFFREPDFQLGFVLGPMTMGQVLSSLMILVGAGLFVAGRFRPSRSE
ncbi:MAG: prolipoprotein diacylglyceryl transferase [Proteobacteria bacterium]|nr:prolipoprotein diacylglyceryl transferase [Pseudomonadota bacterium]MBU1688171.1 prolipoprotein diacylglyceryl transferase [Pseudomonadota bacterium]